MSRHSAPDVRTRILDAALALLAGHGFTELTQPRIARAAGVRQSHLTYYFPTRSDLLKAVAAHSLRGLLDSVGAGAPSAALTPELFAQIAGEASGDKRRARVMLGLIVSSDEDRQIKQFLRSFVAQAREGVVGVARLLGGEPDATDIAAFHMLLVGAAVLNVARDDADSKRECAEIARVAVKRFLMAGKPDSGGPRSGSPRSKRGA